MKKILLLLVLLFVINLSKAATISGNIYNWDLQQVENVRVTINTTPQQLIISKDGTYSFEVPTGNYLLKAEYYKNDILEASVEEEITITNPNGNYIIDLILFPNLDIDEDFDPFEEETKPQYLVYLLVGLSLLIILIITFFYQKRKSKKQLQELEGPDDLEKVLDFIKKQDGRTTQKEIRKALGLSEAKASLIITELEHKNIVKRIKKGRTNIIILNK
jgi:uncharacterized membrane protein